MNYKFSDLIDVPKDQRRGPMKKQSSLSFGAIKVTAGVLSMIGLYVVSRYSYLAFHTLVELVSIVIGFGLFMLAWNSRRIINNNYLLFVGIAYLFVSSVDLIHTLTYKEIDIFQNRYGTGLTTQLWIAARYVESLALFAAPFWVRRKLRPQWTFVGFATLTGLLLASIFLRVFPVCYIEGVGLTRFKIVSEYVISTTLGCSLILLLRKRSEFDREVLTLLVLSIITTICSELVFTFYVRYQDVSNVAGHLLKVVSFYLIYKALIEVGLSKPYSLFFKNLKQHEEDLRESQKQMDRAQEIAHLGSWELDLVKNRLSWSDEVYRIFGLKPQEFGATYEAFLEAVHPEDREAVDAAYSGSLREGRDTYEIEHRVVRRSSGEIRVVHEKCEHFRDETGRIVKSVGMVHDITERKAAEQALREARDDLEQRVKERTAELRSLIEALRRSEAYLAEAQRLSHAGSWAWDVASNMFTYSSEENSRIYGVDKQKDLETESVLSIIHPEDRDRVKNSREKSVREKVDTSDEFRIVLPDGTIKHIHVIRHPILNDAGDVVQLVGTSVDITERRRSEEALRRLNRELRAVSMCNQTLLRATDEQTLLNDICRIVCDEAGYRMAWVGYAENDEARTIRPVAWAGFDAEYVASAKLSWLNETERGRGPGGIAIRTGQTYYFQDVAQDPTLAPWRDGALLRGYRSGIAVPLKDENGKAFGAMMIYSDVPDAFTPNEVSLMEELAGDLALGISVLRTRAERKKAEQDIALLSYALDNVREAAFLIEENSRFHFVNEEGCRVLGYTHEELLGLGVADIDPEFPVERWPDHWRDLTAQRSLSFEGRHRTKGGRIFPVEIKANYFEYDGRAYNLALVRDITERRAVEEVRSKLAAIVESSEDAIISKDLDGTITSWNEGAERLYGYSEAEALGKPITILVPLDQQGEIAVLLRRIGEGTRIEHYETQRVRKDGRTIPVSLTLSPIRDRQGQIVGASTIARDISAQKRAEEERRQSAERFRAIADYTYDWEDWIGVDGRVIWVNPAVERITGYSVGECMSMPDFPISIVAEPDREVVAREMREAVQGSSRNDFEFRVRRKDGHLAWVAASWQPIYDSRGARLGYRSSIRDIAERKQAQEALQKLLAELEVRVEERTKELSETNEALQTANKELESFSYSVSHDLRAPLLAIDGFSQMVLKGYGDKLDDEGRRKLNVICNNTRQMGKLIDDLLTFSRLGRKELVTTGLDMEALVRSAWKELTLLNPERRIQFSVKRLPQAMGDQALIKEVVVNLLSNAIKFTKFRETAVVEVGAYPEEERNVYFVKDNGVGFDMQYYNKLFGVFQRLHSDDEFEGTGVGLAIVQRIIRRHGGRVWAEGKMGEGASFYFTLTRSDA